MIKIGFPGFILRAPKWKEDLLAPGPGDGLFQNLFLIHEDEF